MLDILPLFGFLPPLEWLSPVSLPGCLKQYVETLTKFFYWFLYVHQKLTDSNITQFNNRRQIWLKNKEKNINYMIKIWYDFNLK